MDERRGGGADAADRAAGKKSKERSVDDYKRKIYRLRLEVEQERLRCDQLRQQRDRDLQQLAERHAAERTADAERLRASLAAQSAAECAALRDAHAERERDLSAQLDASGAEAARLHAELQRVAAGEAREALSSVHSETLSKLFRESKALRQQAADWQRRHEQKCTELKDKAAECEQAQRELERERQRALRESLSLRLSRLKQQERAPPPPSPPSDGGSGGGSGQAAADSWTHTRGGSGGGSGTMASTDRERELQRKLAELGAIVHKHERRLESLKEENAQLKKRDEAVRSVEEKLTKLKKRNGELAELAKKLGERNKLLQQQLQTGGQKRQPGAQDAIATAGSGSGVGGAVASVAGPDLEHVKKVFARQRAKDLAEHAKTSLAKDRELEALRKKCHSLADCASNEAAGGVRCGAAAAVEIGELTDLIKITAKERLHLEWLKSRDWDDGGGSSAATVGVPPADVDVATSASAAAVATSGVRGSRQPPASSSASMATAGAGAIEALRSKLDSLLEENTSLSRRAAAAVAECDGMRHELQSLRSAGPAAASAAAAASGAPAVVVAAGPRQMAVENATSPRPVVDDDVAQAGQLLRTECSALAEKVRTLESERTAIALEREHLTSELNRLQAECELQRWQQLQAQSEKRHPQHDATTQADISTAPAQGGSSSGESRVTELLQEIDSLREDKQELLTALEENTDLKKEVRTLSAANKVLRKDCDAAAELQRRLDAALLETDALRSEARRSAERQSAAEAERAVRADADAARLSEALQRLADGDNRCERLRLECGRLENECATLQTSFLSTQAMLADSIQHNGHLQQELAIEREKLASCISELDQYKTTVEDLRAELQATRADLHDALLLQKQQQPQHPPHQPGQQAASDATCSTAVCSDDAICSKCESAARAGKLTAVAWVQTDRQTWTARHSPDLDDIDRGRVSITSVPGLPTVLMPGSTADSRCAQSRSAADGDVSRTSYGGSVMVRNSGRVYHIYVAKCTYDPACCSTADDPTRELIVNAGDYVLVAADRLADSVADGEEGGAYCEGMLLTGARGHVRLDLLEPLGDLDPRTAGGRDADTPGSFSSPPAPAASSVADLVSSLPTKGCSSAELSVDHSACSGSAAHSDSYTVPSAATAVWAVPPGDGQASSAYGSLHVLASADTSLLPCPQHLQLERQLSKSIVISWDAPDAEQQQPPQQESHARHHSAVASPPVYAYNVYIDGQFRLSVPASGKLTALVEGVQARVPHRVSVTATGGRGESDVAQCTIVIGEPPAAPSDVHLLGAAVGGSATVAFLPNSSNNVHAVLLDGQLVRQLRPGVCRFHLDGLAPGAEHRITLVSLPASDAADFRSVALASGVCLQSTFLLHVPETNSSDRTVLASEGRRVAPRVTGNLTADDSASPTGTAAAMCSGVDATTPRLSNGPARPLESDGKRVTEDQPISHTPSAGNSDEGGEWATGDGLRTVTPKGSDRGLNCSRGSQTPPRLYVAVADYEPTALLAAAQHVVLKRGQIVRVFEDLVANDSENFVVGEVGSRRGYVPCSLIQELPVHDDQLAGIGSGSSSSWADDACEPVCKSPSSQVANERGSGPVSTAAALPTVTARRMPALYDYDPQQCSPNVDAELELAFRAGDVITVLGEMDEDGFYQGLLDGRTGLVPSNYLQH